MRISDKERKLDADAVEGLLREDEQLAGMTSNCLTDEERDANERQRLWYAAKYNTPHIGTELLTVIRQGNASQPGA